MKLLSVLICAILLSSCEKNINFKLKVVPDVLVVDASIENNQPPIVVLSKSFDYFSKITPEVLDTSFVHNATVSISNGTQTQQLKEYSVDSTGGYVIYYYSIDTANMPAAFIGQLNTYLYLKVVVAGNEYTAVTTIPTLAKKIDSLWWKPTPFADDSTESRFIMSGQQIRRGLAIIFGIIPKQIMALIFPGQQSVFDDELIDGTTYDLKVQPGIDRNNPIAFDKNFFHRGDTVTLKLSNIDRATYQFWLTMEFAYQSIGNPFASPIKCSEIFRMEH